MGTSRNDPSPGIPPWKMARTLLGRPDASPERQVGQIWRAASADLRESLQSLLSSESVAAASEIAASTVDPTEARSVFGEKLASAGDPSLFVDLAQRAMLRACARGTGRAGFAEEFFSEATSYYASRDLPSVMGTPGRIGNAAAGIDLKRQLKTTAATLVHGAGSPPDDPGSWGSYVERVLERLKRGG